MKETENQLQLSYRNSLNKAFHYIDENLNENLSLDIISQIACFSPFHFHRIFKALTGETLNEYIGRRRIEKSAIELIHKSTTIEEVSLKYGFNDISTFSRAFKRFYKMNPTQFRKQNPYKYNRIRQYKSKNRQEYPDIKKYIRTINNLKNWIKMNASIEIKRVPKMELAYVSNIGDANMSASYSKLINWATSKGLMTDDAKLLTIYHNSFKITSEDKVRMSVCLLLKQPQQTSGEIGLTSIEETKCIVSKFEISLDDFEKSWTGLFVWMNENGYERSDQDPFEIYHNNFNKHPEKKAIVDFYIPIK